MPHNISTIILHSTDTLIVDVQIRIHGMEWFNTTADDVS